MSSSPAVTAMANTDKKDLDKYTKYLSLKAVQVVVQSRLGEKCNAASFPDTSGGTSWYNLAIRDIPEVTSETKKSMSGQLPSPGRPLVVEISLKTVEGDSLVLEWWRLAVVAGGDPQVKVTHAVYNRMGLLLKSLVTVTRITPAYKLSRRQGQDSYVICYRIFLGDPVEPPDLGEGALTARVGQVATPESTIVCCVDYRTSMTITPRPVSQPILVKSDHFDAKEETPKMHRREHRTSESSEQGVTSDDSQEIRVFATSPLDRIRRIDDDPNDRLRFGAFARTDSLPCLEEELQQEPLLNLIPRPRPGSAVSVTSGETSGTDSHTDTQFLMSSDSGKLGAGSGTVVGSGPTAAVAGPSSGAAAVVTGSGRGRANSLGSKGPGALGARKCLSEMLGEDKPELRRSSSVFGTSEPDREFVMIDLKTPFAQQSAYMEGGSSTGSDPTLGSFFKDVSSAPSLQSLPISAIPIKETLQTWGSQLSTFESNLHQYDDMLEDFGSNTQIDS